MLRAQAGITFLNNFLIILLTLLVIASIVSPMFIKDMMSVCDSRPGKVYLLIMSHQNILAEPPFLLETPILPARSENCCCYSKGTHPQLSGDEHRPSRRRHHGAIHRVIGTHSRGRRIPTNGRNHNGTTCGYRTPEPLCSFVWAGRRDTYPATQGADGIAFQVLCLSPWANKPTADSIA